MTNPLEHNPLLAYLQAWRQLLEASAAITSGWPVPGPSGMPPMPAGMAPGSPMPPMPPGMGLGFGGGGMNPPTDYAQQLFGYLQSWRHYLEQAVSNASGTIQPLQPTGSAATPSHPTAPHPAGSPAAAPQPTESGSSGSKSDGSSGSQASGSQSSFPPKNETPVVLRPRDPFGTISDLGFSGQELFARPDFAGPTGPEIRPISGGSAFAAKMTPADSPSPTPSASQSLFSGRSANAPASTVSQPGRDPRRAAPPASSRWWEAGQGRRPGFAEAQPEARNLVSLRPLDLGGKEQ